MADLTDNKELLKEIESLKEAVETALDGLKERDKRIEKLEKSLLLVLGLSVGHYADKSAKNFLSNIQTFALEQAEVLVKEYGGTEKVIEDMLATTEKRLHDQRASFQR